MSINDVSTRPGGGTSRGALPSGRTDRAHFLQEHPPSPRPPLPPPPTDHVPSPRPPPPPETAPPAQPDTGPTPGPVNPGDATPPPPPEDPGPVEGERECVQWVNYEVFITRQDERVCPICGPLHGAHYEAGTGPQPPLHTHCRCQRLHVRRECINREGPGGSTGNARF